MRRKHPSSVLKKTASVLLGQEKTPHPEDATRCRQGHGQDSLPRPRCGPPPRLPAVQRIRGPAASRNPRHHGHRLPGPTETAWPHHDAEKAQQKESSDYGRQAAQPCHLQRPHPRRERHWCCETFQDRRRPIQKPQKAFWPALYAHCCGVQQGLDAMKLCKRSNNYLCRKQ